MASQSDALPTQTENIAREGEDGIDQGKDGGEMTGQPCRKHEEVEREDECEQSPAWHPIWLRPLTLLSLSLVLLLFTVSLPLLLQYSRRNNGLSEARDSVVYLWKFGPTASRCPDLCGPGRVSNSVYLNSSDTGHNTLVTSGSTGAKIHAVDCSGTRSRC